MRKQLAHIRFYYKWYLIAGAAVLLLLLNFWHQKRAAPDPDYSVAIVSGRYVDEQTRSRVSEELETIWDDRDGDGTVTVAVYFYQYDGKPDQAEDTSAFMAAAVQLAADLQERISLCFFTDCPEALNGDGLFSVLCEVEDSALAEITDLRGFEILYYGDDSTQVRKLA